MTHWRNSTVHISSTLRPEIDSCWLLKFSQDDLSRYECPAGLYHGRPVWWDGATNGTLSNDEWKNETCDQISTDNNEPQVL